MELELRINGVVASLEIAPNESLLSMLRQQGYYSVKSGCETGDCGACTVLVDGVPRPSCVMLAAQAGGCTLSTVESLGSARKLHPLQQAFVEVGAVQCGFCTPGMLLSASALLKQNPAPTENEVRDALSGNLCRCSGYVKPVQAVMRAAAIMRGDTVTPLEYNVIQPAEEKLPVSATARAATTRDAVGATTQLPRLSSATTTTPTVMPRPDLQARTIGQPVPAIDAIKLVTGRPAFVADIQPRNMLHARILTSPHAHAIIRDIDASQARALSGVHAVLTYKDVSRIPYSSVERTPLETDLQDQYCLDHIVRYVGDRVAVVAAESPEIAAQALCLIDVHYDVQPAILDPRQSLDPSAPRLHPEAESRGIFDAARNVAARVRTERGDVEQGFAASDLVVEGEYTLPIMHQAPLENHTVVTYFDEDDYLVVRTNTQAPHHIRRTLAHVLNVPASHIRVVKAALGGGFGVKQEMVLEDLCALLTIATNRPVMLAYSRAEEFASSRVRQQYVVRLKTGVKRDGTILANQMMLLTSTGAYGTHPLIGKNSALASALSLYPCPSMRFVAEVLYTNLPPSGAYRGYGTPQETFALESHMDEVAKQVGIDALALRRKNWIKTGDVYPLAKELMRSSDDVPVIESCGLEQCLKIVEEKLRWFEKRGTVSNGRFRHGVGIALSLHGNPVVNTHSGTETSGAIIKLNEDGSFDLFAGANDAGNGTTTLLVQIAAEVLGVSIEQILMHASGTDIVPFESGASASATLYASGGAVQKAAEQVRRQILAVAGRMLNTLPESLKINAGVITSPGGQTVTIPQVASHSLYVESRHIMTTASWRVQQTPTSFAAQGVEVEVDTETGAVRVLKAITAVDAGRVLNPLIIEGQVQGSATLGLGSGLSEELIYDQKGVLLTTTLRDYHIYSAPDMPELQTYLIETNDPSGLLGSKAVAEISWQGIAPAIANAVADALRARIRQAPFTPERVLRAIHANTQTKKT